MEHLVSDLLKPLGTFAIVVIAAVWLVRELFMHTLSAQALQNEIRYRSVFEQQMTAISETYSRLVIFHRDVQSLTAMLESSPSPSKAEKGEIVYKSWENFSEFFYTHAIFLPESLVEKTALLANKVLDAANKFIISQRMERGGGESDLWIQAVQQLDKEASPLLQELRAEFQRLLGTQETSGRFHWRAMFKHRG